MNMSLTSLEGLSVLSENQGERQAGKLRVTQLWSNNREHLAPNYWLAGPHPDIQLYFLSQSEGECKITTSFMVY